MSAFGLEQLEKRIAEMESQLQEQSSQYTTTQNNLRKSERHIKELTFKASEDRKNQQGMQSLVDELQAQVKTCAKQLEEAEEIAALNLAKYKKTQQEMEFRST